MSDCEWLLPHGRNVIDHERPERDQQNGEEDCDAKVKTRPGEQVPLS